MLTTIWILAETNDGAVAASYYEMLTKARAIKPKAKITALCMGGDNLPVDELKKSGADEVVCARHAKLENYDPMYYTAALAGVIAAYDPDAVLVAASARGSEVAPGAAARLKTGLAAHCTELAVRPDGDLAMIAPAFGGKLMGEYYIPNTRPQMASVKPGVFDRVEQGSRDADVIEADVSFLDGMSSGVELVERKVSEAADLPVDKAESVVCVGLGVAEENIEKARALAKRLNAALGYTRPMVDMGYMSDESAMIGTSGKTIKPKLYIGFGVSGSNQHVCGMKDSGLVISINNNPKAEIFNVSDYKLVADSGKMLDELLKILN